MRRFGHGFLLLILLGGCHGPADDFAKLDVPDPTPAAEWVQYRHEPGGYSFQAPKSWQVEVTDGALQSLSKTGTDLNLFLRIVDPEAARHHDMVMFAILRVSLPGKLEVMNLKALGEKTAEGMKQNTQEVHRDRRQLAIGPAEHIWGTTERVMPDGRHRPMTSHIFVLATALRPFFVSFAYPAELESKYLPTLDAIVQTLRLTLPKADGKVVVPGASAPMTQAAPTLTPSNPSPVYTQAPAWGSQPPSVAQQPAFPNSPTPPPNGSPVAPPSNPATPPPSEPAPPASSAPQTGQSGAGSSGDPSGAPPQEPPAANPQGSSGTP